MIAAVIVLYLKSIRIAMFQLFGLLTEALLGHGLFVGVEVVFALLTGAAVWEFETVHTLFLGFQGSPALTIRQIRSSG